jgi:hypothetical protein
MRENQQVGGRDVLQFREGKREKGEDVLLIFLTEHHAMKAYWGVDI